MVPTRGVPAQSVGFEKLIYAPSPVKKAVMLGNYHGIGSEPNESLVAYEFETNSWSVLDKGSRFHSEYMPEGGHPGGDFAYDPNRKVFMYLCCNSGVAQAENLKWMWWYDPIGQSGRAKPTALRPPIAHQATSAFDPATNKFVLHGGSSFVGTWIYDPAANTFQKGNPLGTPPDPSVLQASSTYNANDQKIYLFGGANPGGYSNDLFAYSAATNTWTKLNPSGSRPAPRSGAGFAYDSRNNIFMVYGGVDGSSVFNDTWIYNPTSNSWAKLTPPQSPPVGAVAPFEMLTYDSDHNVFIMALSGFGGYADGNWNHYSIQTWLYRYDGEGPNPGSAQPDISLTPGAVNRHGGWAKDPTLAASDGVLYAGWVETGRPFDTSDGAWLHAFASRYAAGGWSPLGGNFNSLDSEYLSATESFSPSMAIIAGTPWLTWYKGNNSNAPHALWAKKWNSAAGVWEGGKVGVAGPGGVGKKFAGDWSSSTSYQTGDVVSQLGWYVAKQANTNITPGKVYFSSLPPPANGQAFEFVDASAPGTCSGGGSAKAVCRWNGNGWEPVSGLTGFDVWEMLPSYAGRSKIASVNGAPYIAFLEGEHQHLSVAAYVKYWDGDNWVLRGNSALNVHPLGGTVATSIAITSDGTIPYVAWTEYSITYDANIRLSPAKVYVARWDSAGNQWAMIGNGINVNPEHIAEQVSITWLNGQPYVAWTERAVAGNNQLYVKTLSGGNWVLAGGGSLNRDTNTGWAYKPSIVADSTALYVGWVEQRTLGERAQSHVSRFSAGSWSPLGNSLNADPALGSAQAISIAVLDGKPVAAWGEVNAGSTRQLFTKQWNGSDWALLTGSAANAPCDVNQDGVISTLDIDAAKQQALGSVPCNTADLQKNGTCNVIGVQRVINAVLGGECKVGQ
jgi:hypothetical protein